ncbi:MAG: hypothetical protein JSR80_04665 [Verrucomicrobia bacterium]|nr:hypothetical protein [Verrucomicrobiota bacterium]
MTEHIDSIEKFRQELDQLPSVEEKIRHSLNLMRILLSEGQTPRFRLFWEVRTACIPLFKEGVHPAIRSQLWQEFSDLSKEARSLKEHLDKQSAFAIEQIELAVEALDQETSDLDQKVSQLEPLTLPFPCKLLEGRLSHYDLMQRKLAVLNNSAQRINSLRKEIGAQSMRVRDRTRLFKRLSSIGDKVFPVRRDLTKQISRDFVEEVDRFIAASFSQGEPQGPLYILREEIRGLQGFAKLLTLNTHAFSTSRERLSECWDLVRSADKERKKDIAQKKASSRSSLEGFELKLEQLATCALQLTNDQITAELDALSQELKKMDLPPAERKNWRDKLAAVRQQLFERVREEKAKQQEEIQRCFVALKEELHRLEVSREAIDQMREKIERSPLARGERAKLLNHLLLFEDRLVKVQEEAQLAQEGESGVLFVLRERKKRRVKVKEDIEALRKAAGGSGFDIEAALQLDQQLQAEKSRLEEIEASIAELEQKIGQR